MLQEIWSGVSSWVFHFIAAYFRLFLESPPPISQVEVLLAYIIRNRDIFENILDLSSFMFVTPELARRFLPSRKMLFQNYLMVFIIFLPIFSLYRSIAWLLVGFYWHAGVWGLVFFGSSRGLILSWGEDAKVVRPLLISERVSKLLLPVGIALFLLARALGLYVAVGGVAVGGE